MEPWVQIVLTVFSSVLASSGLWTFLNKIFDNKDVKNEMLIGLAHDRIVYLGMKYIERSPAYITQDEYENLHDYLYVPYEKMGGNGSARRIMQEVEKLPIKRYNEEVHENEIKNE